MFTSNELLHLVFADPSDEYYSGLLKLDLDQYLWLKLHEKYETVYFLKAANDGFSVHTLGDRKAKTYEPAQSMLTSVKELFTGKNEFAFGDWMIEQMKAKRQNAVAFVCAAEDFCRTAREIRWNSTLEKLASEKARTGILVLTFPLEVEQSKRLLLDCNAFSRLGDSTITAARSGIQTDLFRFLLENKSGSCTILSPYTDTDRCIHSMLLRLQLGMPDHVLSAPDFKKLETYLITYLGDLQMQITQPLFPNREPSCYLSYHNLFRNLEDKRVWDDLVQRSLAFSPGQYKEKRNPLRTALPRDRSKPIGKCVDLFFAKFIRSGTCSSKQVQFLTELLTAKSIEENPKLLSGIERLLARIASCDPDDTESYSKFLKAVQFCNYWLYVPSGSDEERDVLSIIEKMDLNIQLSQTLNQYIKSKKQIQPIETHTPTGTKVVDNTINTLETKIRVLDQQSSILQEVLDRVTLDLSLSSLSKDIMAKMNKVALEIASSLNLTSEDNSRGKINDDTAKQSQESDRSADFSHQEKYSLQNEQPQIEEVPSANTAPSRSCHKPPQNLYSLSRTQQKNAVKE